MSSDVQQGADQADGVSYAEFRKASAREDRASTVVDTQAEPLMDVPAHTEAANQWQATAGETMRETFQADASETAAPHEEAGVGMSAQEPARTASNSTAHEEAQETQSPSAASAVPAATRQQSVNTMTGTPAITSSSSTGSGVERAQPPSSSVEVIQADAVSIGQQPSISKQTGADAVSSSSHDTRAAAAAPAAPVAAAAAPPTAPNAAVSSSISNTTSTGDGSRALRRYPTTSAGLESFLKEQNMLGTEEPKKAADPQQQGSVLLALLAVGALGVTAAATAAWNWWQGRRKGAAAGQEGSPEDAAVQEQLQKARKAAAGANAVAADIDAFLEGIGDSIDEEDLPPARPRAAAAAAGPAAAAQVPRAAAKAAGTAAPDAAQEAAIKEQEEKARRAAAGARAVAADIDKFLDLDIDEDVDLDQLSPEELAALENELAELEGLEA